MLNHKTRHRLRKQQARHFERQRREGDAAYQELTRQVELRPFPGMIPELAHNPVYMQQAHPKCFEDPDRPDVALCGRPLALAGFRIRGWDHYLVVRRDDKLAICEACVRIAGESES